MKEKRVVVTGMGIISPMGNNLKDYWNNLMEGKTGISSITKFDASELPSKVAGQVKNFDPKDYIDFKMARRMDEFSHFGVAASNLAMEDAGLSSSAMEKIDSARVGSNIGSGIGGIKVFYDNQKAFDANGWKKVSPLFIPMLISNICSSYVSIIHKFQGPNYSMSTACATSNHCLLDALHIIKRGDADIMVSGGTEGALIPFAIAGFCSARALSTKRNDNPVEASRPFDKDRDGFVISEGSGILVLEELEHAKKRNAKIYAEIAGAGMSCDAYHITEPHPEGLGASLSMENAMKSANIGINDVEYINSHGTSTIVGDIAELKAIKKLFGDRVKNIKINSTKSMIGHLLGAAGGVEAIATILSLQNNKLHPTLNIKDPIDEAEGLDIVSKTEDYNFNIAMSNSFGFGGQNCSLIIKKYEQ